MSYLILLGAIAGLWWWNGHNARRIKGAGLDAAEARRLLGVSADAGLGEIRAAHQRLIARVHPDAGGSAGLSARVNAARDLLVRDLEQRGGR